MDKRPEDSEAADAAALAGELRIVIGQVKRKLREQGGTGDLTWSQTSVLGHLEREGPATVTALARAEGVRPQSMGATVAGLEAAGLVSGAPDPNDRRQTVLSLTAVCREWIEAARAARRDWLFRAICAKLTAAEQAELAAAVKLLKRMLEP